MAPNTSASHPVYVLPDDGDIGNNPRRATLADLKVFVWAARTWIVVFAVLGVMAGVALDLVSTKYYEAKSVLIAVQQDKNAMLLGSLGGQLGGLASLAGIGGLGNANQPRTEALTVLSSDGFIGRFITQHKLMPILFSKIWDAENQRWKVTGRKVPTVLDAATYFKKRVLTVSDDQKTGVITVNIRWKDRYLATNWANMLVADLNDDLRMRAVVEAQASLNYLNGVLKQGGIPDAEQQAIYNLIEGQMASETLAHVREQFALKVLDKAAVPDEKSFVWPNLMTCILGSILFSLIFGLVLRRFAGQKIEGWLQTRWQRLRGNPQAASA